MLPKCGKKTSNSGKSWTQQSIQDHEQHCPRCLEVAIREWENHPRRENIRHPLDDDIPDGAYWAMRMEGFE